MIANVVKNTNACNQKSHVCYLMENVNIYLYHKLTAVAWAGIIPEVRNKVARLTARLKIKSTTAVIELRTVS